MKQYVKGNYRRSIFESDSGYVIGLFKAKETNISNMYDYIDKTITFTGYFHDLNVDDSYILYGEELEHPKYGFQFQVSEYEKVMPTGKEGLIIFLASDLFPGIGEKMAEKIVETLGDNTIERILTEPDALTLVPRLSSKKAINIKNNIEKYEESHTTIVYLNDLGFSMRDSLSIYNKYKSLTTSVIEHNIFKLLDDNSDLQFPKLDDISKKMGYDSKDDRRIKAAIIYVIRQYSFKNGDTFFTKESILRQLINYIKIDISSDEMDIYLHDLEIEDKIVIENRIYLKEMYMAEENIADRFNKLNNRLQHVYKKLDSTLEQLEKMNNISYNSKQKEAIASALTNNVTIITGGPGTGKTTIIKAITYLYEQLNKYNAKELDERLALLAPTGRASKRMSEATLNKASTIHRFLKWNKDNNEFAVNEYNQNLSSFVIVDEVSMIDTLLLDNLFKGLTDNIQLVLVGDYNQLPSVGAGALLKDMIDSDTIPTVELELLYRQDENSYISALASEIKDECLSEKFLEKHSDYTFLRCSSDNIRSNLKKLCKQMIAKGYDTKRVQIMAPMYRGNNGIDVLNTDLQEVFNPKSPDKLEIKYGDVIFRENDKILQLVNMPDENVFNGDVGIIAYIITSAKSKSHKNEIYIDYDGTIVKYLPKDFIKIKHGFVITIHKSQGSEFEAVIMPITHEYHRMLYKKLVYTGITRAKKKLILLGEAEAFTFAVHNNNEYSRHTSLKDKLIEKMYSNK